MRRSPLLLAAVLGILVLAGPLPSATAHEAFKVGNNLTVKVGWLNEPPIVDQANAITIQVTDNQGNGVEGLSGSLHATILYGGASKDLSLSASDETQGLYFGSIIPTVEGIYKVHVTGSLQGTSADHTVSIEKVESPSGETFPESYGARSALEGRLSLLMIVAGASVLVAIVALILAIVAMAAARSAARSARDVAGRPPAPPPRAPSPVARPPSSPASPPPPRR